MNFSSGLIRQPEEDFDLDLDLLHVLGSREREVVVWLDLDVILDDFLDQGDIQVEAFSLDILTDTLATKLRENDSSFSGLDFVDGLGENHSASDNGAEADQFVRDLIQIHLVESIKFYSGMLSESIFITCV